MPKVKKTAAKTPVNYDRFWFVIREREKSPYCKHLSLDIAKGEAKRLSRECGSPDRPFYICEVVGAEFVE